ncbi:MAG: Rab family GTPase [Candidatus Kariarchaeaceae archaeon]
MGEYTSSIPVKIAIIGDPYVGKTSLVTKKTKGFLPEKYLITLGVNISTYELTYENNVYSLQIHDIAGQKHFQSVRSRFYSGSHGALVVFDLNNIKSFQSLSVWIREFTNYCGNTPLIIIGNKSDLNFRVVTQEQLDEFFDQTGISTSCYLETSALDGTNVDKAFELVIEKIVSLNNSSLNTK